jgi:hypothetical protein
MECECGKEMKEIHSQCGRDYYSSIYYCAACNVFWKDESVRYDRFYRIDDVDELKECRELVDLDD